MRSTTGTVLCYREHGCVFAVQTYSLTRVQLFACTGILAGLYMNPCCEFREFLYLTRFYLCNNLA